MELLSQDFIEHANANGVSYALLRASEILKVERTGRALSASQYAYAERRIRQLVNNYEGNTIDIVALSNIVSSLNADPKICFDFSIAGLHDSMQFEKEKNIKEWVRHPRGNELKEVAIPDVVNEAIETKPVEKSKIRFGFKFF